MSPEERSVVVLVAGISCTFTSFESLQIEVEIQREAIRSIEERLISANPTDPDAWRRVEQRIADLTAVLNGMRRWIAAEDVELNKEIAAARAPRSQKHPIC